MAWAIVVGYGGVDGVSEFVLDKAVFFFFKGKAVFEDVFRSRRCQRTGYLCRGIRI